MYKRQSLECILGQLDMVLIMTVNPGFGGQKFIPYTLDKVRELKNMLNEQGLKTDIQVDGGVNAGNVQMCIRDRHRGHRSGSCLLWSP